MRLEEKIEFKEFDYHIVNCPVCKHKTLDNHYICENCGWEYDGVTDSVTYSIANSSYLDKYKKEHGYEV